MSDWQEMFAPGFGNPDNILTYAAGEYQGWLYFGTRNLVTGAELYRTDGERLECVIRGGFGDQRNIDIFGLVQFAGRFYAGTYHHKGAQLYRSADGLTWECVAAGGLVNPLNIDVYCLQEYGGWLHAGTCNLNMPEAAIGITWTPAEGAELLRSRDGRRWERVWKAALPEVNFVRSLAVSADGALYAGTGKFSLPACLLRVSGTQVEQLPLPAEHGEYSDIPVVWARDGAVLLFCGTAKHVRPFRLLRYCAGKFTVATADGFGNPDNIAVMALTENAGMLYAVTRNLRTGVEVWFSADGNQWQLWERGGFGDAANEFCTYGSAWFRGALWVTTHNRAGGGRCYRGSRAGA